MSPRYCPNCGNYVVGNNTGRCLSCNQPIAGEVTLPPNITELVRILGDVSNFTAITTFTNLWTLATPEQKATLIDVYIKRAVERVSCGYADEHIKTLVGQMTKSADSPTFFAEESRAVLSAAFAKRLDTQLNDPSSKEYGYTGQAMLQDSVLLSSIAEASKKIAEEYKPQIENLIRDRLAANLDQIVDAAVKKVAADALANVTVKKA